MSTSSQGVSGPSARIGLQPFPTQIFGGNCIKPEPASTLTSPEQSTANQIRKLAHAFETFLTLHQESSMTKDKVDTLLGALDKSSLGADDGNVIREPRSTRILVGLERIKDKLRDVSDRVENMGRTRNHEDAKAVAELLDDIRGAVIDCQSAITKSKIPGELPPPAPRSCFGREEIVNEIIGLIESLEPIALIGAGGIGKTSIALKVLHHNRIKRRFGENRRFIRCDQFPATLPHFLNRFSKVIGASVENPEDLTPLLPFLSSREMLIVLDNAESILDSQGANAREIYTQVEELCRLDTVSLCITSHISTVPPDCETLDVPTLSIESARETFYRIYKRREGPDMVDVILKQLDFHPLSITLFATIAHQNKWDTPRLIREWEGRRTGALTTEHQSSLATTIELSLTSPLFKGLGPDARGLLGVVAFYPQGINENNLDWLFPTIPDVARILDKFCILSLTYRSNGFTTMLAPLRDHLCPKDPTLSPLLCTTKERFFDHISIDPNEPEFKDAQWIVSDDLNVEHLLNVFTSVDPGSNDIWDACMYFMAHLCRYKPRQVAWRPKIEALPDNHHSKPGCLFSLAALSGKVGNHAEVIRVLNHLLKLERQLGDDQRVAATLGMISKANEMLGRSKEGIHHVKDGLEIYERLGETTKHALYLDLLAGLLQKDGQLDAAEKEAIRANKILREKGEEFWVCVSHRTLGDIYHSKGQREKAIHHFEAARRIASIFNWRTQLFRIHLSLAQLFLAENEFCGAYAHIEQGKSLAVDEPYNLGCAANVQARILFQQGKVEEATSELLVALDIFEKLGALEDMENCKFVLQAIRQAKNRGPPSESADQ